MKTRMTATALALSGTFAAACAWGATAPDILPPKVVAFSVPALTSTLRVPVTAFTATDNVGIAGFLITESGARPSATSGPWSGSAPASYTATAAGTRTLYAWAKDKSGNVSPPVTATVMIDTVKPVVDAFALPASVASLSVPVAALAASDNLGVTGYLVTATANVPGLQDARWTVSPPAAVTVAAPGAVTLYAWARDQAGNVSVAKSAATTVTAGAKFNLDQTLSDGAQRTTLAFAGLGLMTGNLEAQSFFPPGKVADYTGFQYLRDNDPDNMGHNTSFLTRVANNVIAILTDVQFAQLAALASAQAAQIDQYGYQRFTLMQAFRRTLAGALPAKSAGLNRNAVTQASRALYLIDGQISFDRAVLYATIVRSLGVSQIAYLDAMKGKGFNAWPDIPKAQIDARMKTLAPGTAVAVMTYAGDLFSWYAGSIEADVYFCPERHGTYFGSFYMKDAPAVGHEGYGIDEQLTATAGAALSDSTKGYVTAEQAAVMSALVEGQRGNLYTDPDANIVWVRTRIATLLRSLLDPATSADAVKTQVLTLSGLYGELDGENNHTYATTFVAVWKSMTDAQKAKLQALRKSILAGAYADGTPFDFTVATTPYLYSAPITNVSLVAPYLAASDRLFFEP
ncbi:MAG: hypothetical protein U1F10_08265 [Burkholderiales bacterium]